MEAPQELVAALAAHGEALAAELRALDDMPQVKLTPGSVFDRAKPPRCAVGCWLTHCGLEVCSGPLGTARDRSGQLGISRDRSGSLGSVGIARSGWLGTEGERRTWRIAAVVAVFRGMVE